jgi:hypothetical protein
VVIVVIVVIVGGEITGGPIDSGHWIQGTVIVPTAVTEGNDGEDVFCGMLNGGADVPAEVVVLHGMVTIDSGGETIEELVINGFPRGCALINPA